MLMCYLRVCPFTKPIGQDCTVEQRDDQCCPVITCPEGNYLKLKNPIEKKTKKLNYSSSCTNRSSTISIN